MAPFTDFTISPRNDGATEWVAALINACRETHFAFELAAGGSSDKLLRAELLQYSGQRREFIAELIASQKGAGNGVVDPGNIRDPLQRKSDTMRQAVDQHDTAEILRECETAESAAMGVYRDALSAALSPALHAMLNTQLAAINRVRDRIERLRANAQSSRN